ncbi:MAG TPA: 50S ribosomal protein L4, partial [Candidatus Dojkabacteria bacterium]|nr:50S ribosomal protein L4 [Candidatus Dojkabacteria bacterium]
KQKGTGRARSGSSRSPLWVKGGVTFVPNDRNWERKINKKMVNKAICMMLSERLREGVLEFVNIETKNMKDTRTKLMNELKNIKNALVISENNDVKMGIRNVENINYINAKEFSVIQLVKARKVLVDNNVVNMIEERFVNGK